MNTLTFSAYASMVSQISQLYTESNEYLDSIPRDIRDAIFSNKHADNAYKQIEVILKALLPSALERDLEWYMEGLHSKFSQPLSVSINEREYSISSTESYLDYVKKEFFGGEDNGEYLAEFKPN